MKIVKHGDPLIRLRFLETHQKWVSEGPDILYLIQQQHRCFSSIGAYYVGGGVFDQGRRSWGGWGNTSPQIFGLGGDEYLIVPPIFHMSNEI